MRVKPYVCIFCKSPFAQPIRWEVLCGEYYKITFRCPECDSGFRRLLDERDVDELGNNFGDAYLAIERRIEEINYDVFAGECEVFIATIWSGNVLPEDF